MALTDKLTSIAAAIREKGGTTEKLTLDAMPTAIAALPTGGGDMEPIVFTNGAYLFANDQYNWLLEKYDDKISFGFVGTYHSIFSGTKKFDKEVSFVLNGSAAGETSFEYAFSSTSFMPTAHNLSGVQNTIGYPRDMFYSNTSKKPVPDLYMSKTTAYDFTETFCCMATTEIGTIHNAKISKMYRTFADSHYLKHCPIFENATFTYNESSYSNMSNIFAGCYSMRSIPYDLLKNIKHPKSTSYNSSHLHSMFQLCSTLDEIDGLNPTTSTMTSNMFATTFNHCYRLKRIKFLMNEDGTPFTASWKNQTIDLSKYVGWAGYSNADQKILNYNSGITADKEVGTGKGSYAALKNDPDWWSREFGFSRFGHDAAVEFINSLPDTEAYLVSQNASNNIVKFYTNAGMYIDGGGVSNLTEEEIAVAAAKGWTISYTTA